MKPTFLMGSRIAPKVLARQIAIEKKKAEEAAKKKAEEAK